MLIKSSFVDSYFMFVDVDRVEINGISVDIPQRRCTVNQSCSSHEVSKKVAAFQQRNSMDKRAQNKEIAMDTVSDDKDAVRRETGETHSGKRARIIVSKGLERVWDGDPWSERVSVRLRTANRPVTTGSKNRLLWQHVLAEKFSRYPYVFSSNFLPAFSACCGSAARYSRLRWLSTNNRRHGHERASKRASETKRNECEYTATRYQLTYVLMRAAPCSNSGLKISRRESSSGVAETRV